MAARPNPLRTLISAQQVAQTQVARLNETLSTAKAYLAANDNSLSVEDRAAYHSCIMLAMTQLSQYTALAQARVPLIGSFADAIPLNENGEPKRRGRPSKAADTVIKAKAPKAAKVAKKRATAEAAVVEAKSKAKNAKKTKAVAKAKVAEVAPVKRGPGRPRKEVAEAAPVKRGPGRPKKVAAAVAEAPKRRGRPPGSKNKSKDVVETKASKRSKVQAAAVDTKPRRGRPPGSKNKPKTPEQVAAATKDERAAKRALKAEQARKDEISRKRAETRQANKLAKEKEEKRLARAQKRAAATAAPAAPTKKRMKQAELPHMPPAKINALPLSDAPAKRRGRPPGSKNKPKVINGHNGEDVAQTA